VVLDENVFPFADSPLLLRPRLPVHRNHGSNDYPAQYRCTTTPAPSRTSHLISGSHHPGKAGISQPKAVLDNMSVITPPDVSPLPKTYRGALSDPHGKAFLFRMQKIISGKCVVSFRVTNFSHYFFACS
jgi:hypothetical protein